GGGRGGTRFRSTEFYAECRVCPAVFPCATSALRIEKVPVQFFGEGVLVTTPPYPTGRSGGCVPNEAVSLALGTGRYPPSGCGRTLLPGSLGGGGRHPAREGLGKQQGTRPGDRPLQQGHPDRPEVCTGLSRSGGGLL